MIGKKGVGAKKAAKNSSGPGPPTQVDVYRKPTLPVSVDDAAVPETLLPAGRPEAASRSVALVTRIVEKAHRLQEPAVAKYVARLRAKHPDDSPEQLIGRLERRYLNAVTVSGGAVGATASIPGVGTVTALSALGADTALFIEASALLALAIAEVHGISPEQTERRRALVLSVALGEEGIAALGKVAGVRGSDALARLAGPAVSPGQLAGLNRILTSRLVKKFAVRRAPLVAGKLIPGGIGAAIGGAGNRALGTLVLRNAREAFGPPPRHWDVDGTVTALRVVDGRRR
ncbi:hypothetical protein GOHSU_13_00030 [Gordonia hirsuta DSM 44140 = NBRC 16056]|uniref:EcsC family protein n=1 Tax=Gordonia hirsuta DSM 44140 = NBRC 16056 TaxID=1121927 RepID=L7L7P6_9ACTN|nr:hypothetical protein [Gordonia hirsuta]GAC56781.1 hypothetical protein GOHSU_13_00030 [Gordonia hirsuta DSM 44140 = NBRC 16056]